MRGELLAFARKVAIVIAFVIVLALLWLVRNILFLIFIAAVLAAGISPAVRRVRILWRYWFRRHLRRGTAVMIVYLPFVIAVLLLALVVLPRLVDDVRELGHQL
ncbi:MAG TPA: hypothetical protein VN181_11010, partial [Thermoanaerobaculia bacterium]|nr:hypothetical protein [Thermoanaerobaculia bacterium]